MRLISVQCSECNSEHIRKSGRNKGKQNHICVDCARQFIDRYGTSKGYSNQVKRECLKLYVNGMSLRGIEQVKGIYHTTVIKWVKQVRELLPGAYDPKTIALVRELDELDGRDDTPSATHC